eukprot:6184247-Pleurochrysis_carterae.AAC.4
MTTYCQSGCMLEKTSGPLMQNIRHLRFVSKSFRGSESLPVNDIMCAPSSVHHRAWSNSLKSKHALSVQKQYDTLKVTMGRLQI